MDLPVITNLSPTRLKHGLNSDDGDAKLPGLVLLVSDTLIEHYWATIRRHVRRRNTTDRRNRRILAWDGLIHIGHAIEKLATEPCWRTLNGGIDMHAVASAFMRAVPSYNVTRPRFLSALHFLFGLKVAPEVVLTSKVPPSMRGLQLEDRKKHMVDRPLLRAVSDYFDGFDLDKTGKIDWRDLVCRLQPYMRPMNTPQQHLLFCFEIYTADQTASHTKRAAAMSRSIQHPNSPSSKHHQPETTQLALQPRLSKTKTKDYAALLRSPPKIHPELSLQKACQLCGLYATTEIMELRMFDIARKAYENLPEVLREARGGHPTVTSIGFREMLTVDMSDSARARRSDSARHIALRKYSDANVDAEAEEHDTSDDGLGSDDEDSSSSSSSSGSFSSGGKGYQQKHTQGQRGSTQQMRSSPWAQTLTKKMKRKKKRKVVPTLGQLMAPLREVAMKGPHRLVTTYNLECSEFSNKWLHPEAVAKRTEADNQSKLRNFVQRWQAVKRIKVIEVWRYWSWRRRRLRAIVIPAARRFYVRNTTICMFALKIGAVQHCAAIWIQKVWRAHFYGREQAHFLRYQIKNANFLQKWWVKAFGFIMWMRRLIRRSRAAQLIQRIVRGFIGRCRARHALIKHYEAEWERILLERAQIKIRHERNAAVFLQSRYRGMIARRIHAQLVVEKRAKEMEVEMEKTRETEETRLTRLYQQQLRKYWAEQKRLIDTQKVREEYDYNAQWQMKIARLKRRWEREIYKKKEDDEARRIEQKAEDVRWEETWVYKIEDAVEEEAKRVLQLFETGGSGSQADKDKSKAIRTLVQSKSAEIKQRFRSSGVPLTDTEARVKAKKIAQEKYSSATRVQMENSRKDDRVAVAERRQLEWEAEQKSNGNLSQAKQKQALHIIQGNIRKYAARQEVKRRIRFNYRKEFHPEHLCYFYQHRNNGTVRWEKPRIWHGRSDLPAPKRWYHIRDTSFEPGASYWLKPRTADMTFDVKTLNAPMCNKHPHEFAVRYCADCMVKVCEPCYIGKTDPNVPINSNAGELKNHRKHNAVELDCGIPSVEFAIKCDACGFVLPSGRCSDCATLYCNTCFRSYHENDDYPEYQHHQLELLDEEAQAVVNDIIEKREEERLSQFGRD